MRHPGESTFEFFFGPEKDRFYRRNQFQFNWN